MSTVDVASRPVKLQSERATTALSLGLVTTYLSLIVGLPIAALVFESTNGGWQGFWDVVTSPEAIAALKLTLWTSIAVALINAVLGTITAWVLVRDSFRGQVARQRDHRPAVRAADDRRRADAARALRAAVAGRDQRRLHDDVDRAGDALRHAPVRRPDGAAGAARARPGDGAGGASRSARANWQTFRRVVFPNVLPGILSGVALAFAKAVGEFGSLVIITGQPAVQDAGLLGLHLQPDRERRPAPAPRRSRSSCSRSRSGCCSRSARSATTRRGTTVASARPQVRAARDRASATWRRSSSGRSALVFYRTFENGFGRRLGRALDAGDRARVQADADHHRDRRAR